MEEKREHFASSIGFVLAMVGSAVGLGNIWRFPYITGVNGGGAFVLIYLLCICFVGIPIMFCEMAIGRKTQKNPYGAFAELEGKRRSVLLTAITILVFVLSIYLFISGKVAFGVIALIFSFLLWWLKFKLIGLLQIVTSAVILSYYSVVGGWALAYVYKAFTGQLQYETKEAASQVFGAFITNPYAAVGCQLLFMILCILILVGGVRNGIERWSKILMPALFVLLVVLIVRNLMLEGSGKGVKFFLYPDFSKLSREGFLEALGHSFYTLSLAMGIIITYGSYLSEKQNLFKASFQVALFDTVASIMAGLAIFPAVFAMGFNEAQGPSLLFEILPAAFSKIPGGMVWCGFFFLMLSIAAITSGMSLLEIVVAFLKDQFKVPRMKALIGSAIIITMLGTGSALSVANWNKLAWLKNGLDRIFGAQYVSGSFFDMLDTLCSNWSLPLSGFFVAVFAGWIWGTRHAAKELNRGAGNIVNVNLWTLLAGIRKNDFSGMTMLSLWAVLIRFIVPIVIWIVFLHAVGLSLPFFKL